MLEEEIQGRVCAKIGCSEVLEIFGPFGHLFEMLMLLSYDLLVGRSAFPLVRKEILFTWGKEHQKKLVVMTTFKYLQLQLTIHF